MKMKTNSSAKKRFIVTGSGKIKHKHAYKRHLLTKKGTTRKRNLGGYATLGTTELANVQHMLRLK